jgi:hypothetical protein
MADPQRDLAPIVEPPPPPVSGAAEAPPIGIGAAVIALVFVLALASAWQWRRGAPLRALRRLPQAPDPVAAADRLAAILRRRGVALDAAAQAELERLRFGPPLDDAAASLAHLCHAAETAVKERR